MFRIFVLFGFFLIFIGIRHIIIAFISYMKIKQSPHQNDDDTHKTNKEKHSTSSYSTSTTNKHSKDYGINMIACDLCQLHVPENNVIYFENKKYCCEAHAQMANPHFIKSK